MIQFDIPKDKSSIIKVFGVGGGGSNAVNHMHKLGIEGVNYVICNTDNQALELSEVPNKIQLGSNLRGGLGAGSKPEIGREATEEAVDKIEEILQTNTKMVFITAGMGGGTGTGGAPVVARLAKDMGILTVGIVTTPFGFEGKKRKISAEAGIQELKNEVDALLVISNDKLKEIYGNLKMSEAFGKADDILTVAAKGIAEIITKTGYINVDFEDVNTVMRDSGVALMGVGSAKGEARAISAIEEALKSPLLNDNNIKGANSVLLNISYGSEELDMDEMGEITDYVQDAIGVESDNLIWGLSQDDELGDDVRVTLIATGFESKEERIRREEQTSRVVHQLNTKESSETKAVAASTDNLVTSENKQLAQESHQIELKFSESKTYENQIVDSEKEYVECAENSIEKKEHSNIVESETFENENASPLSQPFRLLQDPSEQPEVEKESQDTDNEQLIEDSLDERLQRLRSFGARRIHTEEEIEELESVPAYKRKNMQIDTSLNSSSSENMSVYNLGDSTDSEELELGKNTYLHDNVD